MSQTCANCHAETDANLCTSCLAEIEKALAETPADHADLTAVATRQAAGPLGLGATVDRWGHDRQWDGPFEQGSLGDAPWDFAPGAADQLWAMENTLTTWARHIAETHGLELPARRGEWFEVRVTLQIRRNRARFHHDTIVHTPLVEAPALVAARWLLGALRYIAADVAAAQIHDELTGLAAENERWTIGRQAPTIFAGRCDAPDVRVDRDGDTLTASVATCGAELNAHDGDTEVRCPVCGHTYQLAPRRAQMRDRLDDEWATAQVIADSLTTLDEPINAATLRSWILRDSKRRRKLVEYPLIVQVGIDDDNHPLYRVGDVRARIAWSRDQTKRERIGA